MRLIFFGPPGAGKGTLAGLVSRELGVPTISTGDIFREAIKNETPLGRKVKEIVARGDLVPDELTVSLVKERLGREDVRQGFILDGFPRTVPQAEALEGFQPLDGVVTFNVSDEEVIKRLSSRRVCASCGTVYNVESMPPKKTDVCDSCGGALAIRPDDTRESITNRLNVYKKETAPLVSFYRERNLLREIDSSVTPDHSLEQLRRLLGTGNPRERGPRPQPG